MKPLPKFFCELCGEIPAMKREPSLCPICGGEITVSVNQTNEPKRFPTSDERAAEWFKKMREATEQK
jgi:hypothetical protein